MKRNVLIISFVLLTVVGVVYLTNQEQVSAPAPSVPETETMDPSSETGTPPTLEASSWVWEETVYANGEVVLPNQPGSFVLSFIDAERFGAQTDCNNVGGSYVLEGTDLAFSQMMSTKMACMNETQEATFTAMLEQVDGASFDDAGRLVLDLSGGTGRMVFTFIEG